MYGIIELAKRKVNHQRSPPEGHAQTYREKMRQACDAANREAKRRKKGQIADDAQELQFAVYGIEWLELGQPRGLLGLVCEVEHLSEAVDENKF